MEWRCHCAQVWIAKLRLGVRVAFTSLENALSDTARRTAVKQHLGNFQAVEKCVAILVQCSALLKMGKLAFIARVPI